MSSSQTVKCHNNKQCTFAFDNVWNKLTGDHGGQASVKVFGTGAYVGVWPTNLESNGGTLGLKVKVKPKCKRKVTWGENDIKVGDNIYFKGPKKGKKWTKPKPKSQGKDRGDAKGW